MNGPLLPDRDSDRTWLGDPAEHSDEPAEELLAGRARRIMVTLPWLLASVLAAGLAGFVIGDHHQPSRPRVGVTTSTSPADTGTAAALFTYLNTTSNRCSAQTGPRQLELGVEIENQGNTEVEVRGVTPVFPLHGLQTVTTQRGTCGQPPIGSIVGTSIEPGSAVWITTTVNVLSMACPAPLPVEFDVSYTSGGGQLRRDLLTGFSDLGNVSYSGCRR